jgi:tellurite resistance protein
MIKKLLITLLILFLGYSASAETIAYKLKGNIKFEGTAAIEVNATPLVDEKIIEKSKDKLVTIINYANNQSQTVKKKIRTENQEQSIKVGQRKSLKNLQIVLFILKIKKTEELAQGLLLITRD